MWHNGSPVAQIEKSGVTENLIRLHTDHLATTRLATDNTGKVVWRWDGEAFGATLPNEDPDGDGVLVALNLRFPGQYADVETGLFYNYFRYYDPKVGRYITSDPIGLDGGDNTYRYVGNDPLGNFDPFGLFQIIPPPGLTFPEMVKFNQTPAAKQYRRLLNALAERFKRDLKKICPDGAKDI